MSALSFVDYSPALKHVVDNPMRCVMHISVYALDGTLIGTEVASLETNSMLRGAVAEHESICRQRESTRQRVAKHRAKQDSTAFYDPLLRGTQT